jgi:hypothetical protein
MNALQPLQGAAKAVALALALAALPPAQAGTALWCTGTFANHWISADGTAYVVPSWRGDHIALCNVNTTNAAGVTSAVCLSWTAIVRSAMQRNAPTVLYYGDAPVTACAQMPTYSAAPTPGYLMLQ